MTPLASNGLLLASLLGTAPEAVAPSRSPRPNVLIFLADDMGPGDTRSYDPACPIPTPHLDRLAEEGLRFLDAHSPSSVCSPSRYGLLVGRYCWRTRLRTGVLQPGARPLLEANERTLASMLRGEGYRTACIGKWHLGLRRAEAGGEEAGPVVDGPLQHGFDEFFGVEGNLSDRWPKSFLDGTAVRAAPESGWNPRAVEPAYLERAQAFLHSHLSADPGRPFFLYYSPNANHKPYVPAERLAGQRVAGATGEGPRADMVLGNDRALGALLATLAEYDALDRTLDRKSVV